MSILSKILGKLFPSARASQGPAAQGTTPEPSEGNTAVATAVQVTPMSAIDVERVLDDMAAQSTQPLNWKTSIVDLMKLLGLDSSLAARKELAGELKYTGDTNDSATMNIWLHRQVMNKVAANGGKVPAELKD